MKVFLAATSLDPAYGGPAYSVSRLASALAESGVEVGLWSSDGSAPQLAADISAPSLRHLRGSEREALESFGNPDVIHDNGVWMPHNHRLATIARRRSVPRVVSTRGMLEPWALKHKQAKKKIGWWLYQRLDLKRAAAHHVTATTELDNLLRLDLEVPVQVIPNGVDLPELHPLTVRPRAEDGLRTAVFIGRLYPVKGLPMLIEAWSRVRPSDWRLLLVGPDESGHRRGLENAIRERRLEQVVTFAGPLEGTAKSAALRAASLFILPTHSESFGMAIAEALAHGLPVLTTMAAPWPGLGEHRCGWRVDPSVDGLVRGLREALSLDDTTLSSMGAAGRALVESEFRWDLVTSRFRTLYRDVVEHGG